MKKINKILSIILAIILIASIAVPAFAETGYDIWINGEQFTSAKKTIKCSSGTATLDTSVSPYLITLDKASISNAYYKEGIGNCAIYSGYSGGLNIKCISYSSIFFNDIGAKGYGIYSKYSVNIDISCVSLYIRGNVERQSGNNLCGIYVDSRYGSVNITGHYVEDANRYSKVEVIVGEYNGDKPNEIKSIYSRGGVTVTDASLAVTSHTAKTTSIAIQTPSIRTAGQGSIYANASMAKGKNYCYGILGISDSQEYALKIYAASNYNDKPCIVVRSYKEGYPVRSYQDVGAIVAGENKLMVKGVGKITDYDENEAYTVGKYEINCEANNIKFFASVGKYAVETGDVIKTVTLSPIAKISELLTELNKLRTARSGYTFSYWKIVDKNTGADLVSKITSSTDWETFSNKGNAKFKAVWNANPYTITYNTSETNTSTQTVKYNATFTPYTASKAGCTLKGWSRKINATTPDYLVGKSYTYSTVGDTDLYPVWAYNTMTVTFDANGGNATSPASKTVTYMSKYGELPTPVYSGKEFLGWYDKKTGGNEITANSTVTATSAHTLYAHWGEKSSKTMTVTFDANGGNATSPASKTVTYMSKYGELPTPVYSGKEFLGWYDKKTGGTEITASSTVTATANHTLYAHWGEKSDDIYLPSGTASANYKENVTVNVTAKNIPTGYWLEVENQKVQSTGEDITVSVNLGQLKETKQIALKVTDGKNIITGTNITVSVSNSIFAKIGCFFSMIFRGFNWGSRTINF